MDDFDDSDIARAIALSLQESQVRPGPRQVEYINVDSDDELDDYEEARFRTDIKRSVEPSKPASKAADMPPAVRSEPAPSGSTSAFISDRAQLERERLARQKRLRPDIDVEGNRPSPKRQRVSSMSSEVRRANAASSSSASSSTKTPATSSGSSSETLFWDGQLRQVANMHVEAVKDKRPTFRLTEIIGPKEDIEFAIISSFQYNFPWIYSLFHPGTPVIAVAQDAKGAETMKEILPNWIKTTPFQRNGWGCMHMKFMLLFYKTGRLRILISTANLVEYDWRDIENSAWVQDIPARPSPIRHDTKATDFSAAFMRVLIGVNAEPALMTLLRNGHPNLPLQRIEDLRARWDFSKVKAQLVPSLAGKHEGWPKVIQVGHPSLMKAVMNIGGKIDKTKKLTLECQGSSIGNYSTQWMNEFYCSAKGCSAEEWLDKPKSRLTKLPYPPVKIIYPSLQTVQESVLGEPGGGTMFCRRPQWEATKFPRELFHDSKSKRGKVLMHSKMILATIRAESGGRDSPVPSDSETEAESDDDIVEVTPAHKKLVGWLYVGSHNFTSSAWGTLSGSAFNPTLNIMNYELGVVLPLTSEMEADQAACWERPPRKYVLGKDRPWMQAESAAYD